LQATIQQKLQSVMLGYFSAVRWSFS